MIQVRTLKRCSNVEPVTIMVSQQPDTSAVSFLTFCGVDAFLAHAQCARDQELDPVRSGQ